MHQNSENMDIVVENLTKTYGVQKAVDNISFTVKTGEVLGFLGPNGAGKTTTMKAITTYLMPNAGNISVGQFKLDEQPEEIKKHIGYLPESNPLYQEMPVIDYLHFVASYISSEKARKNKKQQYRFDKKWISYRARRFFFILKQVAAFFGGCFIVAALSIGLLMH